jgi:hypothetical protein
MFVTSPLGVVELVASFFEMLYPLRIMQGDVDRSCWIPSKRHI